MNNQPNAFFFEIQLIPDDSKIFEELKSQELFFSYIQVHQKYYLFFYSQKPIDIDRIEAFIHRIQELDTKQRKIRSLRGFFLYALEIIENENDFEILSTNLQPSFWRKLRKILRQNKKTVLLQFLFGSDSGRGYSYQGSSPPLEELQNQVNSLQERIVELENQNLVMEGKLNMLSAASRSSKFATSRRKEYHTTFNQNQVQNQRNFLIRSLKRRKSKFFRWGFVLIKKEKYL